MSDRETDERPLNCVFIEWIYEIDFDNLVFHVNSEPMFRLDNMPPSNIFLKSISYDHFGHTALREDTPVQFRCDWGAPPPPPSPGSLAAYNSCHNWSSTSSIHDLLSVPAALSSIERARTAFVGIRVTRCMVGSGIRHHLRMLENVPDHDHIPECMHRLALLFVNFAVGPPIPSLPYIPHRVPQDFIWIRKDVCLRITTHLNDEDNLRASIGDLVRHISTAQDSDGEEGTGTVYGIACSIFHCAVVRVDKDVERTSFSHTPALQFLPSFFARKISMPGIEAISRLGCRTSGVEFLTAISDAYNLPRITHEESLVSSSTTAKVPIEVWIRIGDFLTSQADLVSLGTISPQALSAAADLARFPWVREFRLVDVVQVGSVPPVPGNGYDDTRYYFCFLGRATFTAVRLGGGHHVNVELSERHLDRSDEMAFEVETYLGGCGSSATDHNEFYVSEVDDDDKATGS